MNKLFVLFVFHIFLFQGLYSQESIERIQMDSTKLRLTNDSQIPIEYGIFPKQPLKLFFNINDKYLVEPGDTVELYLKFPLESIKVNSKEDFLNNYVSFEMHLGNSSNINHNDNFLYTLPFPKHKKYRVIQGFNGKFSHKGIRNKYSIDFNLKVGDTVTAARGGVVVQKTDFFKEHGRSSQFLSKANFLTIMHDDGTFADYAHLSHKGILVNMGDKVKVGQPIAISGQTGFATSPHLHFRVYGAESISIPFKFKGLEDKVIKQGRRYKRKE